MTTRILKILAVDPGTNQSALVSYEVDLCSVDRGKFIGALTMPNDKLLVELRTLGEQVRQRGAREIKLVIEKPVSYGMPVGAEIFDTCIWIGRFIQVWPRVVDLIGRKSAVREICQDPRGRDTNVRAGLIEFFGGKDVACGTKDVCGPLHDVHGDEWAALAVAVGWSEIKRREFRTLQRNSSSGTIDLKGVKP